MKSLLEFLINNKSTGIINQIKGFVDLGLPSNTLWCEYNLGTNSPEEPGLIYAWGQTQGYNLNDSHSFSQENYNKDLFKNDKLNKDNDAAAVALGKDYHMPTLEQCMELQESTEKYYESGKGFVLISKFNNNEIVFVETKGKFDTTISTGVSNTFWINSAKNEFAKIMKFDKNDININIKIDGWERWKGLPIRPVKG